MLNAHMAFDSDCFSHAIAKTRRYLPDCTRLVATTAVDPQASSRPSEGAPIWPWLVGAVILVAAGAVVALRLGRRS